jgi:CBS domain-containing protein
MRVADLMNRRAAAIVPSATMQRAAELLVLTQASDLCVVDHDNRFLGIVSEGDLIRAAMPDFDEVIAYGASNAQTLEILLETGRSIASEPVERLIIKSPLTLAPDDSLMRAAAVMLDKMIRRLPVVEHERLLGTLSRADLVWGMMCLNTNQRS